MRFLCLYKPTKPEGTPPTQEEMEKMTNLVQDSMNSGVLIVTEGCLPSVKGARVRRSVFPCSASDGEPE